MPPGVGYPAQQPGVGLFQDISQIPPQLQQQLYRQFLGEQLGFLPPSPPGGGGGVLNLQGMAPDFRQPQQPAAPAPQGQPAQQQPKQPRQQPQQQAQPQQPIQSQPIQPALPQIPAVPALVPPGTGGAIPNLLAPAGGTIGANTGAVVDPLSALLFGG